MGSQRVRHKWVTKWTVEDSTVQITNKYDYLPRRAWVDPLTRWSVSAWKPHTKDKGLVTLGGPTMGPTLKKCQHSDGSWPSNFLSCNFQLRVVPPPVEPWAEGKQGCHHTASGIWMPLILNPSLVTIVMKLYSDPLHMVPNHWSHYKRQIYILDMSKWVVIA